MFFVLLFMGCARDGWNAWEETELLLDTQLPRHCKDSPHAPLGVSSTGPRRLRFVPWSSSDSVDMSAALRGFLFESLCGWKGIWPQGEDACAYC